MTGVQTCALPICHWGCPPCLRERLYGAAGDMIAPDFQRHGTGTRMLQELERHIGPKDCFCLPHGWLEGFYGQIGFKKIADEHAPLHLQERLKENRKKYPQLIAMQRSAATGVKDWSEFQIFNPRTEFKDAFLRSYSDLPEKSDQLAWLYLGDNADLNIPYAVFDKYVQTLLRRETSPPEGFVCDTIYWALCRGEMVGRISIRHELNDFLKKVGGHIGYIVHPRWRNRGVASWMLSQILKTDRAKSIKNLLLTCDEDNLASERTILKNGGVFRERVVLENRPAKNHFWIAV